jgi:single-strand selective monofunctional uracil DNA glycosylase
MRSQAGERLVLASRRLARACVELHFHAPVSHVYHTLIYACAPHEDYVRKYAKSRKDVLFLGMNPGPWGMAQTGIPFGEVEMVRDWLGITGAVREPANGHSRVPVRGFACTRSEVSGSRLWGLMRERFQTPGAFFHDHFVANYCPLLFLDENGRNITPDKLAVEDKEPLATLCDAHLAEMVAVLRPRWLIGIGRFAERRLQLLASARRWEDITVAAVPHPSPASPRANRGWAEDTVKILRSLGVW